jgi:5'-3' exonuclease
MQYLFIDANNLGCRAAFVNKDLRVNFIDYSADFDPDDVLKPSSGFPTGAMHGFFRMLTSVRNLNPNRYTCIVWDGKSKSRMEESKKAVANGVVPMAYKENRIMSEPIANFHIQRPVIMSAVSMTNMPQVSKSDEEADDVIASFVDKLAGEDIMILTNDKDYYQLLGDGVRILNGEGTVLDEAWFQRTYGINPKQWVDVGALCGDDGDCIWGIPWVGEGTAVKEIVKHGTCEAALAAYEAEFGHLREKLPDIGDAEFQVLKSYKTKNEKYKFPHIKKWMPYTGVALAYENDKVKIPRHALMTLIYQSRISIAKSLKGMHRSLKLPDLPVDFGRDMVRDFVALCEKYELHSVAQSAQRICARQMMH